VWGGDEGSIVPLILGFFIIALLIVAASIAASDAFVDQRYLQNTCDGAALAGAEALDSGGVYGTDFSQGTGLPVGHDPAADAIWGYLHEDPRSSTIEVVSFEVGPDGGVAITCVQTTGLAFGYLFGYPHGIRHKAEATAWNRLG
jgi:uncharacterized membrane protein